MNEFRVLYRGFLARTIDLDVLSQRGDLANAIARFGGLLAAFSFLVGLGIVPRYLTTTLPRSQLIWALWNDEEFLLSATIAIAGLVAVLAWNAFLPERKDCVVLGALPLPLATIALAKTAAAATVMAIAVTAVNVFTGPAFPLAIAGPGGSLPAAAFGWFVANAAAELFVLVTVVGLQAILSQILPWRAFLRISSAFQLIALAAVLAAFFASPPFAATMLTVPGRGAFFPSYWFTGLLHVFVGERTPALDGLALIAVRNLGIAAIAALIAGALAWRRNPRRIVETPEITPSRRPRLLPALARACCRKALDRAIFLFTARTMARSRQHRLLLAVYGGSGLALAITFLRTFLNGVERGPVNAPNLPLLTVGWLLMFVAIVGTRAIFVLPQEPGANWVFRITALETPRGYLAAVRRALVLTAAVPAWLALAALYFSVWKLADGVTASLLLLPAGMIFVYGSLRDFRKIPFTCSWSPENAQGRLKTGVWGLVLVIFASIVSGIELWGLSRFARFVVLFSILAAIMVHVRIKLLETEQPDLEFEGFSGLDLQLLDLSTESLNRVESIDAIPRFRLRPWHFAVLLAVAGILYEQAGQAFDRAKYPEVGTRYDIGGRKLNIACEGTGSPTVVFESDGGRTGYMWVAVQHEVARFTRACWYDRAGYGWSDPGPSHHYSDSMARDLHALLHKAGVAPPYVLASSGMGTFPVRVFRGYYPDEVAGLVLAEPVPEDITIDIHNHMEFFRPLVIGTFATLGLFGGSRLMADIPDSAPPGYSLVEWKTIAALDSQVKSITTQPKEKPVWINGELARSAGPIASTPLIVLSAEAPGLGEPPGDHDLIVRLNQRLAAQSKDGVWLSVPAHQNRIRFESPEAIVAAVERLIRFNRSACSGYSGDCR
jgi:hypothetical protein